MTQVRTQLTMHVTSRENPTRSRCSVCCWPYSPLDLDVTLFEDGKPIGGVCCACISRGQEATVAALKAKSEEWYQLAYELFADGDSRADELQDQAIRMGALALWLAAIPHWLTPAEFLAAWSEKHLTISPAEQLKILYGNKGANDGNGNSE